MNATPPHSSLFLQAATAFGLEAIANRELRQLGYDPKTVQPGRLEFAGDASAICRANLWLRTADRILLRMGTFSAPDFGLLFDQTADLPWEDWIPPDGAVHVVGKSRKSQLSSVPACQRIVKKSIVDRLLRGHGIDSLPETGTVYRVEIALLDDIATLTLDTTGPSLHKRGYRRRAGEAPIKETLAAALVLLSFWKPGRPLVDPFCGSGTIPIEAAMIGRNIAPGRNRNFAAEAWPAIAKECWEAARSEAASAVRGPLDERIIGYDLDEKLLHLSREHAFAAGVEDDIHFQQRDFEDLRSKRLHGCMICNPPYGERMGESDEIEALYEQIPLVLRNLPTWSHYVLTSHPHFEQVVGRKADRRRKLYNGRIECTYFQFHGPRQHDLLETPNEETEGQASIAKDEEENSPTPRQRIVRPAFGGLPEKAQEQAELFHRRLEKRARHLRRWPTRQGITCYRLYDRDIPEIPLVVERYEDYLHVVEFERPHERPPAQHAEWLDLMAKTAAEALGILPENLFLKRRGRQKGKEQHQRIVGKKRTTLANEGGLRFEINLSDYTDTGLFLDHRQTRSMLREAAAGKSVLNLFCYTGSFSVYAAAGGAKETTSVDWSSTYLRWAERNMQLNGFDGSEHRFVQEDAAVFLREHRRTPCYDLAVVDPPTFSNRTDIETDWIVQRDHGALLRDLFPLMRPWGQIFFSTNFRRFKLDTEALAGKEIREISRQTVPDDFRNQRIHRCWIIANTGYQ